MGGAALAASSDTGFCRKIVQLERLRRNKAVEHRFAFWDRGQLQGLRWLGGEVFEGMNGNIGLVVQKCLLNAFGKKSDLACAVDRTHIGVTTAHHRHQNRFGTAGLEAFCDKLSLPEGERALAGGDPERRHGAIFGLANGKNG